MMRRLPPCFFPAIIADGAVGMMVFALLRRGVALRWGHACILLAATVAARRLSEPANTSHAGDCSVPRRAERCNCLKSGWTER
jgi:hypothetical protein